MNLLPRLRLKPTFPLDSNEVSQRIFARKLSSRGTWGPFALAGLGIALLTPPGWAAVAVLGATGYIVNRRWKSSRWAEKIEEEVLEEFIRKSNSEQDSLLRRAVARYRNLGHVGYAKALGQFLAVKQHIERDLGRSRVDPEERVMVEKQVDSVCSAVCSQFNQVIRMQQSLGEAVLSRGQDQLEGLVDKMKDVLDPVRESYTNLYEIHRNLRAQGPTGILDSQKRASMLEAATREPGQPKQAAPVVEKSIEEEAASREGKGLPDLLAELATDEKRIREEEQKLDREVGLLSDEFSSLLGEGDESTDGEDGNRTGSW